MKKYWKAIGSFEFIQLFKSQILGFWVLDSSTVWKANMCFGGGFRVSQMSSTKNNKLEKPEALKKHKKLLAGHTNLFYWIFLFFCWNMSYEEKNVTSHSSGCLIGILKTVTIIYNPQINSRNKTTTPFFNCSYEISKIFATFPPFPDHFSSTLKWPSIASTFPEKIYVPQGERRKHHFFQNHMARLDRNSAYTSSSSSIHH